MKQIFRYSPLDALLLINLILVGSIPYLVACYDPPVWAWFVISVFHIWFIVNVQNTCLHHHAHCSVFVSATMNRIYELFVSAVSGLPHQLWRHGHLLHHKHINDKPVNGRTKDPVSVFKFSKTNEPTNFWIYCWRSALYGDAKWAWVSVVPDILKVKELYARFKREQWAVRIYWLSIFLINPVYGLFLIPVYFMAYFVNNANSYGEHWGVLDRRGDTTQDSIGIYSTWYNIFGFGAGYHQEHHHRPGVHWTEMHNVTKLLHPDRKIVNGIHILNNPFWSHFKLLFKKNAK
jgi:fatty acid desaturase